MGSSVPIKPVDTGLFDSGNTDVDMDQNSVTASAIATGMKASGLPSPSLSTRTDTYRATRNVSSASFGGTPSASSSVQTPIDRQRPPHISTHRTIPTQTSNEMQVEKTSESAPFTSVSERVVPVIAHIDSDKTRSISTTQSNASEPAVESLSSTTQTTLVGSTIAPAEQTSVPVIVVPSMQKDNGTNDPDEIAIEANRKVKLHVLPAVPRELATRNATRGFSVGDYNFEGRVTRRAARAETPPETLITPTERLRQWGDEMSILGDPTSNTVDRLVAPLEPTIEESNETDVQIPRQSPEAALVSSTRTFRTRDALGEVAATGVSILQSKTLQNSGESLATMLQGLSFEKFGDPLLHNLNMLAKTMGDSDIVRTVMEAYISHACLKERAPDITIGPGIVRVGGSRAPPAEFVYSNEVLYTEGVPPKVPSKGCGCIGPCRENSNCFCLKRQEMYFASFVYEGMDTYTGFAFRQ
jgi:hypothetical protein